MSLRKVFAGFGALCATALLSSPAYAAFQIEIRVDGGLVATVVDGGAGDLSPGANGQIVINELGSGLVIPNFDVIVDTAFSNANGAGPIAILTNTLNVMRTGSGASVIEFLVSATDYGFPTTASGLLTSDLTVNSASPVDPANTGSVEFQSWYGPNNTVNDFGTTPGAQLLPAIPLAVDTATAVVDPLTVPFSLTNRTRVTLSQNNALALVTGDSRLSPVPEPGSIALLAMGGASLFGYGWRRRKAQAV